MSDDTTIEGQLKEYLMLEMKARDMCNTKTIPGYKYQSMSEFVLHEGRFMGARSKQSDKYPPGQKNMCYKEALEMAMAHTELTYCEGIASSIIPVRHAWCIDRDGNVIDTVWQDGEGYYGVEFPDLSYLLATLVKKGTYGVIDNWKQRWPLLKKGMPKKGENKKCSRMHAHAQM